MIVRLTMANFRVFLALPIFFEGKKGRKEERKEGEGRNGGTEVNKQKTGKGQTKNKQQTGGKTFITYGQKLHIKNM